MKFNFDELTERRGTSSMKWDGEGDPADVLQLWVADMDFRTAPVVTEAVLKRASSGIFGYTAVPDKYYVALERWFAERHGWTIDRKKVIYTSGVVPALSAIIKALTKPGQGVILQTPAYNCFFSSIRNNGCKIVENPLLRNETPDGFTFSIDFDSLEELASDPDNTLMVLCNPHNPTGRVWTANELTRVADICSRHGVRVVSDEIHCELVHPTSRPYTPYATIDKDAIVCCSPSKAFNIAGLQIANIVAPDMCTRSRIDRAINDNEVCDVNPFGVEALQAAYTQDGAMWLDELNRYLYDNYLCLMETFTKHLPALKVCDSESTYLAWIDITALGMSSDEVAELLLEKAGVRISSGKTYGDDRYIRINYACPRRRLDEALSRIVNTLSSTSKNL